MVTSYFFPYDENFKDTIPLVTFKYTMQSG